MTLELADSVADGIRSGDPEAVARCYEVLADPLYRYLLGRGADPPLAEDLVEDTFIELVDFGPRLIGGAHAVRAWLFTAARHNLLDAQRKTRRRGDAPLDAVAEAQRPDPGPGPEELAVAGERDAVVQAALSQLTPDQREVLILRFAAGLTGPEAASALGKSTGAVKQLQLRGLAALARILGGDSTPADP